LDNAVKPADRRRLVGDPLGCRLDRIGSKEIDHVAIDHDFCGAGERRRLGAHPVNEASDLIGRAANLRSNTPLREVIRISTEMPIRKDEDFSSSGDGFCFSHMFDLRLTRNLNNTASALAH
jgi:hypothetical protein